MAGTASFATFAAVASSVLGGIGALTDNKSLKRIGGILALGAGVASLAGSLTGAASAAEVAGAAGDIGSTAPTADLLSTSDIGAASAGSSPAAQAGKSLLQAAEFGEDLGAANWAPGNGPTTPWQKAYADPTTGGQYAKGIDQEIMPGKFAESIRPKVPPSQLTSSDLDAYWNKAKSMAGDISSGVTNFMKNNKELVQMGGQALQSAYGPEAERFDYEKSLMERARKNRNQPIAFKFEGGT